MKKISMMVVYLFTATFIFAQSKELDTYRKESEEIRKAVWAWPDEKFKLRIIPEKYSKASKVVIAHHTEITADVTKNGLVGFFFGTNIKQSVTEVVREVIKLNDKNAISEYSELSFTMLDKQSAIYKSDKNNTYVGIRIIKADGTVKEINADDIVLTKDEKDEKKAKLAVPDLQPGDIVDYFFASVKSVVNDPAPLSYNLLLFDNAPILNYSLRAQLGKKFAVEYRSYNGAPELEVKKNSNREILIDIEKTDIPPYETSLWVAMTRQLPFIRMNILQGESNKTSKKDDVSGNGEITKITDGKIALADKAKEFSTNYFTYSINQVERRLFEKPEAEMKSKLAKAGIEYEKLSDSERVATRYYHFRFEYLDVYASVFLSAQKYDFKKYSISDIILHALYKTAGFNPVMIVSENRFGYNFDEAIYPSDLEIINYLPEINAFSAFNSLFDLPFNVPVNLEGSKNNKQFTFRKPAIVSASDIDKFAKTTESSVIIPTSNSKQNARIEKIKLSLDIGKANMNLNRTSVIKGFYKKEVQEKLLIFEDFYNYERKAIGEKNDLFDRIKMEKKNEKNIEEIKNVLAAERKKQENAFLEEAKNWFEQEITELKDYKIESPGVRHTAPDFIYSSTFKMDGLVKKAGNNFIIEIGKIQGSPLTIKDEQRKRELDVYMPFARSIEYEIELEIPEGYTAEGVEALNSKVENETGFFITEATSNGKTVSIKIKKHYLHNFEPAKNFEKMLQFLDAASNWTNAKLLLKKK
ncbi:MAG: DUF3857 domain-containing protein [Chitinophagaceae bacterium]|nr:DUF3857 domain-containing protein [Chitinophagaceae bacterium]